MNDAVIIFLVGVNCILIFILVFFLLQTWKTKKSLERLCEMAKLAADYSKSIQDGLYKKDRELLKEAIRRLEEANDILKKTYQA